MRKEVKQALIQVVIAAGLVVLTSFIAGAALLGPALVEFTTPITHDQP